MICLGAEERLALFLLFRFRWTAGLFAASRSSNARMRHAPFAINQLARDRWMQLMGRSIVNASSRRMSRLYLNRSSERGHLPDEPLETIHFKLCDFCYLA